MDRGQQRQQRQQRQQLQRRLANAIALNFCYYGQLWLTAFVDSTRLFDSSSSLLNTLALPLCRASCDNAKYEIDDATLLWAWFQLKPKPQPKPTDPVNTVPG